MSRNFAGIFLVAVLVSAPMAYAQRSSTPPASNPARPQNPQTQSSPAELLAACRQNVVQLDERLRAHQKKLATLRTERKAVGGSGGEVARFKLATIDQEIRELSKQSQALLTQIETEGHRCDVIAGKPPAPNRGMQTQQPARPPSNVRRQ